MNSNLIWKKLIPMRMARKKDELKETPAFISHHQLRNIGQGKRRRKV